DQEGRQFRAGVYRPLDEAALAPAADDARFPARGHGPPFLVCHEVPRVPRVRHLVGPSVIALGMGLGAGEFLLWPNLIAVNGFSIWWLFWIGVLTQFVAIVEIERWTIATGESVFAGMARLDRLAFWPWFFLVATLVSFFWPGWASQSAEFTGEILRGVTGATIAWQPLALLMLAVIWMALAVSTIVYNALERFQIGLVLVFFPLLAVSLLAVGVLPADVLALLEGAVSIGRAPPALLTGEQFPTLLIAVAYAGSGGTLLLAQSLWLRDKGFGMAAYQGRIAGIRGCNEEVSRTGYVFDPLSSPVGLARFRTWMAVARRELLLTFVLLILLSVVITTLVVSTTLGTGRADLAGNLSAMVAEQAEVMARTAGRWLELAFLLGGAFVLFSTQLGIFEALVRNFTDASHATSSRLRRLLEGDPRRFYYPFMLVVLAVIAGALHLALPTELVRISANMSNFGALMFPFALMYLNSRLPRAARPRPGHYVILSLNVLFFGFFFVNFAYEFFVGEALVQF
ncbi:MAG: Nramp family divalent metal transporter, partial [Geminicoccales bacterium]